MQKELESQLWRVRWEEIGLPINILLESCKGAVDVDEETLSLVTIQSHNNQSQQLNRANSLAQILQRTQKRKIKKLPTYKDITLCSEV